MNSGAPFSMAFGLHAPQEIMDVTFKINDAARRELHLRIGCVSGRKFKDEAGVGCAVRRITDFSYPITIRTNHIFINFENAQSHQPFVS